MKKKVLASLISSLLVICMLGTSVFADATTPFFTEDFEIEPIDGLYVSMPEIRVYGENLILDNNGSFEDENYIKGLGFGGSGSKSLETTAGVAYDGNGCLKFTPTGSNMNVQPSVLPSKLDPGVYEIEVYVKSDSPYTASAKLNDNYMTNFAKDADDDDGTGKIGGLADNGNAIGTATLDSEWQRVVGRFVFIKKPAGMYVKDTLTLFADDGQKFVFQISVDKGAADAFTDPIYFDNMKIRRVLNAVPSTIERQKGMPTYPLSALKGTDDAQVIMDVKNQTTGSKHLTLITAYYNEDGSLNSVLNVYNTDVPVSTAIQHIESYKFNIPDIAEGGEIKTFVWDGTSSLFPYTDQADSSFTTSHIFKEGTADEANTFRTTPLPGSDNVFSHDNFTGATSGTSAHYGNQMYSGEAKSGVRSLYISGQADGRGDSVTTGSGVNFRVEPNHNYKVEFYVKRATAKSIGYRVSGASQYGVIKGDAMVPVQSWSAENVTGYTTTSGFSTVTSGTVTTSLYRPLANAHVFPADGNLNWTKVTCTFTTPPATALANTYKQSSTADYGERLYWDVFGYGDYAYMSVSFVPDSYICDMNASKTARGAWIDDIAVYDLGIAE